MRLNSKNLFSIVKNIFYILENFFNLASLRNNFRKFSFSLSVTSFLFFFSVNSRADFFRLHPSGGLPYVGTSYSFNCFESDLLSGWVKNAGACTDPIAPGWMHHLPVSYSTATQTILPYVSSYNQNSVGSQCYYAFNYNNLGALLSVDSACHNTPKTKANDFLSIGSGITVVSKGYVVLYAGMLNGTVWWRTSYNVN